MQGKRVARTSDFAKQNPMFLLQNKDPFDKMLLAQAKSEKMFFMTHDSLIPNYNEDFIISV